MTDLGQATVHLREGAGTAVVALGGDQDAASAHLVEEAVAKATVGGGDLVVVDLRDVTFMDASTIHALFPDEGGPSMSVRSPSRSAQLVLQLCGVGWVDEPVPAELATPC